MNNYKIIFTGEVSTDYASPTLSIVYNRPNTVEVIKEVFQDFIKVMTSVAGNNKSIVDCNYYEYKIIKTNSSFNIVDEAYLLHCIFKERGAFTIPVINASGLHYVPDKPFTVDMLRNGKKIFDYDMDSMVGYVYREYIKQQIVDFVKHVDEIDNV